MGCIEKATPGAPMRLQTALAYSFAMISISAFAGDTEVLEIGQPAPELKLSAADGSSRSLAAADQTTVLIFYRGLW